MYTCTDFDLSALCKTNVLKTVVQLSHLSILNLYTLFHNDLATLLRCSITTVAHNHVPNDSFYLSVEVMTHLNILTLFAIVLVTNIMIFHN